METVLNGVEENTYVYKPYGATLAKTGTAADPSFLWNGGSGYRATNLSDSDYYIRMRHFSSVLARWTGIDRFWPHESGYVYVNCRPVLAVDPLGLSGNFAGNFTCIASSPNVTPGAPQSSQLHQPQLGITKQSDGSYTILISRSRVN